MGNKLLAFVLLASFLLSGCAAFQRARVRDEVVTDLDVSPVLKFDDVPVPEGLTFLGAESYAFQTDEFRAGVLKYQGRVNPDSLVRFYRDNMPLYNWRVVNIVEFERRMLNFEKQNESCTVTIDPQGNRVLVVIAVSPRSRRSDF